MWDTAVRDLRHAARASRAAHRSRSCRRDARDRHRRDDGGVQRRRRRAAEAAAVSRTRPSSSRSGTTRPARRGSRPSPAACDLAVDARHVSGREPRVREASARGRRTRLNVTGFAEPEQVSARARDEPGARGVRRAAAARPLDRPRRRTARAAAGRDALLRLLAGRASAAIPASSAARIEVRCRQRGDRRRDAARASSSATRRRSSSCRCAIDRAALIPPPFCCNGIARLKRRRDDRAGQRRHRAHAADLARAVPAPRSATARARSTSTPGGWRRRCGR